MRFLPLAACLAAAGVLIAAYPRAASTQQSPGSWTSYGSDKRSSKYSPLDRIGADNFKTLRVAWTWKSPEAETLKTAPDLKTWVWESTPIMAGGTLYVSTSLSQVAAIDPVTGKTRWMFDPETWKNGTPPNYGFVHRGVAYWAEGADERILFGSGDGYLICLNARTGRPIPGFGVGGRIDLTHGLGRPVSRKFYGITSPPIVCQGVVIVGSNILEAPREKPMPPGDVRGFDVRTGAQKWVFKTIPGPGDFGRETWKDESAPDNGGANVWTMMSADEELGYVYLPVSTPNNDYYGGHRPGNGLFGESLLCVDARTGKRVWHFQLVHHGLWDYDPPAAPNLIDVEHDGKTVRAVAQVTKQGFTYVFDRLTGAPIWPIKETPVPQSSVPGERTSRTQPIPSRPAPFDRQGVTENDLIDFTPELRRNALAILKRYHYGPLFTPPKTDQPTVCMPGNVGGASWAGAAWDPESAFLFIPSVTFPVAVQVAKPRVPHTDYARAGPPAPVQDPTGLPIWKPPYGRITAIDMRSGEHKWMIPLGDLTTQHPELRDLKLSPMGRPARGHVLATRTLLIVGQEGTTTRKGPAARGFAVTVDSVNVDPKLFAFDKATGKLVGEVRLRQNLTGAPMTYLVSGKQYIVFATGGANLPAELIALALP